MAPMEPLVPIAARHGLAVIEDAAQSIGARRKVDGDVAHGRRAAARSGTLSFFPSKNLGGLRRRRHDGHPGRCAWPSACGGSGCTAARKQYFHDEVGFNSRLDTLQAAVLLAKLAHLADWSAARARHAARYTEAFAGHPDDRARRAPTRRTSTSSTSTPSGCHAGTQLQAHLKAKHIGNSIYYPLSLHLQPCFAHLGYAKGSLPASEAASAQVISLPVFPELTEAQQQAVIDAVLGFYA